MPHTADAGLRFVQGGAAPTRSPHLACHPSILSTRQVPIRPRPSTPSPVRRAGTKRPAAMAPWCGACGARRAPGAAARRLGLVDALDSQHPRAVAALRAVGARHSGPGLLRHAAQALDSGQHCRRRGGRPRQAVAERGQARAGRFLVRRPYCRAGGRPARKPRARTDPDRGGRARPARRPARALREAAHRHERRRGRRRLSPEPGGADVRRPRQDRRPGGAPAGREHQARPLPQPPVRGHRRAGPRARRRRGARQHDLGHARYHCAAIARGAPRHPAPASPRARRCA